MVSVPPDVCPGHPLCHDDSDQLVPARHLRQHRHLRRQPRRHVGQDHLLMAGWRHLLVDYDSPGRPPRQGFWILELKYKINLRLNLDVRSTEK